MFAISSIKKNYFKQKDVLRRVRKHLKKSITFGIFTCLRK